MREKLEDIKGVHNQKPLRTDNIMVKRRRTNIDLQNTTEKTKD